MMSLPNHGSYPVLSCVVLSRPPRWLSGNSSSVRLLSLVALDSHQQEQEEYNAKTQWRYIEE